MLIGGLQKFSVLDYPGHLSAIVFTQGCNFRCQFCYNPMLVWPIEDGQKKYQKSHFLLTEDDFFAFLERRRGKLDAIVITGGEPTLHSDLPEFIKKIRSFGFKIKLDTNGTNPQMLTTLLAEQLLDYLAMDFKAPAEKYEAVVGVKADFEKIKESVKIIMNSGLPYEFRTTVVPGLHSVADIKAMSETLKGAAKWYLQKFQSQPDLVNQSLQGAKSFSEAELQAMVDAVTDQVGLCQFR
ncbi:MAG: anaerobic ribonucleoside-triphosphate reductase activating protein [bacterium]